MRDIKKKKLFVDFELKTISAVLFGLVPALLLMTISVPTVHAADQVSLQNAGVWENDFPNIPLDSTNVFNKAQPFTFFSRNLNVSPGQTIHSNIATKDLYTNGSFLAGNTGNSYVQNSISYTSSNSWLHIDQAKKFVFGQGFQVVNKDNALQLTNGSSQYKKLIDNVQQSQLYQDKTNNQYLNIDNTLSTISTNAQAIVDQSDKSASPTVTKDKYYWPYNGPFYWTRVVTIDVSNIPTAANGTKVIPVNPRALISSKAVVLKGLGDATKIIFAINMKNAAELTEMNLPVKFYAESKGQALNRPVLFAFSNDFEGNINLSLDSPGNETYNVAAPNATVNLSDGFFTGTIAADTINQYSGDVYDSQKTFFASDNVANEGSLAWVQNTFGVSFGSIKALHSKFQTGQSLSDSLSNTQGIFSGTMQVQDTRDLQSATKKMFYLSLAWTQPFTSSQSGQQLTNTSITIPSGTGQDLSLQPGGVIQVPSNGKASNADIYAFKVRNDTTNGIKTLYDSSSGENQFGFSNWYLNIGKQTQEIQYEPYVAEFTWTLSPGKLTSAVN